MQLVGGNIGDKIIITLLLIMLLIVIVAFICVMFKDVITAYVTYKTKTPDIDITVKTGAGNA